MSLIDVSALHTLKEHVNFLLMYFHIAMFLLLFVQVRVDIYVNGSDGGYRVPSGSC